MEGVLVAVDMGVKPRAFTVDSKVEERRTASPDRLGACIVLLQCCNGCLRLRYAV